MRLSVLAIKAQERAGAVCYRPQSQTRDQEELHCIGRCLGVDRSGVVKGECNLGETRCRSHAELKGRTIINSSQYGFLENKSCKQS